MAGRGQGKRASTSLAAGAAHDAGGVEIVKDPALNEAEDAAPSDALPLPPQSLLAAGGVSPPLVSPGGGAGAGADSTHKDQAADAQACAAAGAAGGTGVGKSMSFLSLMIGSRKGGAVKEEGIIVPYPTSPKAGGSNVTSPHTLSPRDGDSDAQALDHGVSEASTAGSTRLAGAGGGGGAGGGDGAGSCEAASTGDTVSVGSGSGGGGSASSSWDLFSRSKKDKAAGESGGGGSGPGPRTMILQAETEKDRDGWVKRIRCAMAARQAVKEALRQAAQALLDPEALSLPSGRAGAVVSDAAGRLSMQALLDDVVAADRAGPGLYKQLPAGRIDFDCMDADVAGLVGPLKRASHLKELDLSCRGLGLGSLSDEAARLLCEVLKANSGLTSLALANHAISDKGAAALVESAAVHMGLTQLNLDRCCLMTNDGVQALYGKLETLENTRFCLRVAERAITYRELAGRVPVPLREAEALMLQSVVWPKEVVLENADAMERLLQTWHTQGLEFAHPDTVSGGGGRFQFGLLQHYNGPCGVLAAVQAEILRYLVWPDIEEDENVDGMDWDTLDKEVLDEVSTKGLVTAVCSILWRARPDKDAYAKIVLAHEQLSDPLDYASLEVIECASKAEVEAIARCVLKMLVQPGGVILLLYSVVMTRGLQKVWEETGNTARLTPSLYGDNDASSIFQTLVVLEGGWPFCEQSLVNLFLTGQATADLDPKDDCAIGFLTFTENLRPPDVAGSWTDPTVVGSKFKTPTTPIWVLHGGSHYTVLMARSKGLLKLADPNNCAQSNDTESQRIRRHRRVPSGGMEGEFVLEHYNGLPPGGPRLVKLFMSFNLNENGTVTQDTDEERRRWSIDYSSMDDRVPSDKNVPWGSRGSDRPSKLAYQLSSVWVQAVPTAGGDSASRTSTCTASAVNTGPRLVQAHDVAEFLKVCRATLNCDLFC